MSKRSLMLSTAAVAVLSGTAMADTTIDASKTDPYTTGALASTSYTGTVNAGNVTITSAGSIAISKAQPALTVNTSSWVLVKGSISNKGADYTSAIKVDMSTNPNLSGVSFQNAAGSTITGTGLYLDSTGSVSVSGSYTGKVGIYLDSSNCSSSGSCSYTGNITLNSSSSLAVSGDSATALQIGSSNGYGNLVGDVTIGGTVSATAGSTGQTTTSEIGLLSYGTITGDLYVTSGGTVAAYGHGAVAMSIQGYGITKSLTIAGTVKSSILSSSTTSYTQSVNTTTNAEAGSAVVIAASVLKGVEVTSSGVVSTVGLNPAVLIDPSSNSSVTTQTSNLTIGVNPNDTINPGFSFYNRGSITAGYTNYNKYATGMAISGSSSALPTTLTGGLFNSGTISATAVTSGTTASSSSVSATGLSIGNYVVLGAGSGKNAGSGTTDVGNQAALVSSGSITASVSGTRGGTAKAVVISTYATVPSLINLGTISATATTTDATIKGDTTNPVAAYAITDASGTLTSIINSGTISAQAGYVASSSSSTVSKLDADTQVAYAILLGGSASSNSASGVSIKNYSSATTAASIVGDIRFGTGINQTLDLVGNGNTLYSTVIGNVTFGAIPSGTTSGDELHIGNWAVLSGKVTTLETTKGAGVQVDIDNHGTLNLLNTTTELNATTVTVNTGGTLNLGVSRQLTSSGVIAATSLKFASDATLGVTYQSYVPKATSQYVLITTDSGQLGVSQSVIDSFNNATTSSGVSTKPFLLKTASMCSTQLDTSCRPSSLSSGKDALVINVTPKTASELGLNAASVAARPITTANGTATTLFEQANLALGVDDTLGSAFINGITSTAQAAKAYNNMAPNITGGTRAIAVSITDSATGPVAARQRALRMYDKTDGDMTIWGQEFVQMIKDPGTGAIDDNTGFKTNPGYKDHGFGFSVGIDSGSPKYGWYGGALTFYAGDVNELARDAHVNEQWYMLSLYSSWRGKGLFVDTKLDAGYGNIDGKRSISFTIPNYTGSTVSSYSSYTRQADSKHAGELVSGSVAVGVSYAYGAATLMPQINLDGMMMREEGYTETNPGTITTVDGIVADGYDLKVQQAYAKSLRAFIGFNARYDFQLWDFFLQPEGRIGYRYDVLNDPAKIKAAFAYSVVNTNGASAGDTFTLTGPEPSQGSFVLGGSLATTTDSWTLGLNFDFVKGSNGAFQQVGTLHLLGRI